MNQPILETKGLKTHFFTDDGVVKAVDGVDLSILEGQTVGVVGESGCGKSVTSLSIMRLLADTKGRVVDGSIMYRDIDLLKISEKKMRAIWGN